MTKQQMATLLGVAYLAAQKGLIGLDDFLEVGEAAKVGRSMLAAMQDDDELVIMKANRGIDSAHAQEANKPVEHE